MKDKYSRKNCRMSNISWTISIPGSRYKARWLNIQAAHPRSHLEEEIAFHYPGV
jgi:hypothetical protein